MHCHWEKQNDTSQATLDKNREKILVNKSEIYWSVMQVEDSSYLPVLLLPDEMANELASGTMYGNSGVWQIGHQTL